MLSVNNHSATEGGLGVYESFFAGGFKEWGGPFTTMFFCNFYQGTISHVSESIVAISGYPPHYFIEGGIKAFLSIIPSEDRLALLRLCMSLGQASRWSDSLNYVSPSKSFRIRIKHQAGHWVATEMIVIVLSYSDQGDIGRVFGMVSAASAFNSKGLKQASPPTNRSVAKISKRERQVLRLIAHGYSSKMVADKLCISIHTAARHRTNLLEKFQAKNTAELVLMASRRFWL